MHTHGHKGWKGRGGWQQAEIPSAEDAAAWFAGRLPDGWFTSAPEITVDREEILVVGELPPLSERFADDAARAAAESGRISRFREDTREQRIEVARQAEHRYQRKVAWGARIGGTRELFTTLSVPVMTRLRQPERQVLDTLVDSGVARSRSEALAWAVRLVGQHAETWLRDLRDAMSKVDDLRTQGPDLD
jgi:Arc/MetJ-type ribon-helix-helix transcriptional regulator